MASPVNNDHLIQRNINDDAWEEGTRALERFGNAFKDVPVEELEHAIARAIAAVRAERRAEREQAESES